MMILVRACAMCKIYPVNFQTIIVFYAYPDDDVEYSKIFPRSPPTTEDVQVHDLTNVE